MVSLKELYEMQDELDAQIGTLPWNWQEIGEIEIDKISERPY